jgi:hypothetical protein
VPEIPIPPSVPSPTQTSVPSGTPGNGPPHGSPHGSADDALRWAAFSCVLVPVVLIGHGISFAGAAGTALGLVAVTAVCGVLLRQSERGAAWMAAEAPDPQRGRHGRTGAGEDSGAGAGMRRGTGTMTKVRRGGRHGVGSAPGD